MAVISSLRATFEDLRSLAFGGISGTYAAVGTPFDNPVRMLDITNLTDANLLVSFDGVSDKIVLGAQSGKIFDFSSNKSNQAGLMELPPKRVYVKQESGAASSGTFYVSAVYASDV
jgi:hypothetical protein